MFVHVYLLQDLAYKRLDGHFVGRRGLLHLLASLLIALSISLSKTGEATWLLILMWISAQQVLKESYGSMHSSTGLHVVQRE